MCRLRSAGFHVLLRKPSIGQDVPLAPTGINEATVVDEVAEHVFAHEHVPSAGGPVCSVHGICHALTPSASVGVVAALNGSHQSFADLWAEG